MKQEPSNYSKAVTEETASTTKLALNQTTICGTEAIKKDIVISTSAPLSMGLVPAAQLITLQLNNV